MTTRARPARALTQTAALAGGALTGLVGTGAHQATLPALGLRWPVGLVVALALVLAVATAVQAGAPGEAGVWLLAVGWFSVCALATLEGRGGDVIVPPNWRGHAWVVGGAAVLVAVAVLRPGRPR